MKDDTWREKLICRYGKAKSYKLDFDKIPPEAKLVLGCFDIPVTTKCTLRCINCSSLMPYYNVTKNFDIERLIKDVKNVIEIVDYIPRINVLGGEPFIHPELHKLLRILNNSDKVEKVRIITNGTVIPHNELILQELRNPKMQVRISHYTLGHIDAQKFALYLLDKSITFTFKEFGDNEFQWYDFGDFQKRCRSHSELQIQKECCDVEWFSLLNGKLYCCPRAAHAADANLIPDDVNNYCVIRDESKSNTQMRASLYEFIMNQSFHDACDYCNRGTDLCKVVKVAEQC